MTLVENELKGYATAIDRSLRERMEALDDVPEPLAEAMAYSLLAGGKRIRGALLLAAAQRAGRARGDAMPFARALEMIHAYSLIHDDLPAMDNDILRRGKPTNHVVYGEANAILAGDGLLNLAFEEMLDACAQQGERAVAAARCIARAAGGTGMVGGQTLDLAATGSFADGQALRRMHEKKTGALLLAAIGAGLRLGGVEEGFLSDMERYGRHLGMLFQITDDILDREGSEQTLGKSIGKDDLAHKTTYVTLHGLSGARTLAREECQRAKDALEGWENVDFFRRLAQYILDRKS